MGTDSLCTKTESDLHRYQIAGHEAFYIPNFVTREEEDYLIRKILESPQQRWKQLANRRLQLWGGEITSSHVLLAQTMPPFFDVYPDLQTRLQKTGAFAWSPHRGPNHVIVNEYLPGQGIMPHEDGPAYHPVVATLSLGSHSIFHYYKYEGGDDLSSNTRTAAATLEGRTIDPSPVLTVFLEPRSLVITKGSLYESHLHGIREIGEDHFLKPDPRSSPKIHDLDVAIDNWKMVTEETRKVMCESGTFRRGTRYSLTCRDVGRVRKFTSAVLGNKK